MSIGKEAISAETASGDLYYIPLDVETYMPVTQEDIERRAFFHCMLSVLPRELVDYPMVTETALAFDDRNVRAKIVYGGSAYFVDKFGVVKSDNGRSYLGAQVFKALIKSAKCTRQRRHGNKGIDGAGEK